MTNNNNALATITGRESAIQEDAPQMANRMMARFSSDLKTKEQALEFAKLALVHDLNPFLDELIPYQGRPYVTTQGYIRIAERHPAYEGHQVIAATDAERKNYMVKDHESLWKCEVYRTDRRVPIVAWGRAGGEYDKNQPVARARVPEMAQNRALRRALRAAFPVPIPGQDDVVTPAQLKAIHAIDREEGVTDTERHHAIREVFDVESSNELTTTQASSYIDNRRVNTQTGELIEDGISDEKRERVYELARAAGVVEKQVQEFAIEQFGHPIERLSAIEADQLLAGFEELVEARADDAESSKAVQGSDDWPTISTSTEFWPQAIKLGFRDADDVEAATGVDPRAGNVNWSDLYQLLVDIKAEGS